MKTKLRFAIALLLLMTLSHLRLTAFAQGTAFTYQGHLLNGTSPANGSYDFTFALYTASSGGSQTGSTLTSTAVSVTNGLFTVTNDFGTVFNGTPYWLQIGVRTNGGGAFAPLSPRDALTPAPYAIFAENASAAGLSSTNGTVPDSVLNPDVALLDRPSQTFTGTNTFAGAGESFIINSGPISTSLFTGLSLQYFFNSGEGAIMSSYNDGFSSLGFYTKPGNSLPITKQVAIGRYGDVSIDLQNANAGFINNGATNGVGLTFGTGSGEGIASQRQTSGGNQYGLDFYTSFTQRMSINNSGFVGIGRQAPLDGNELFGLYGAVSNTFRGMFIETLTGGRPFYGYSQSGSVACWTELNGQQNNTWELYNNGFWLSVTTGGNVGIGTTVPDSALEVANGDVRIDGNRVLLSPNTTGSFANDGLYYDVTGLAGINNGSGPSLFGYLGGSLGALAPNVIALSWDGNGDVSVSNNLSTGSLTVRGDYLVVNGGTPVLAYLGDDGSGNDVQIGSQKSGVTALAAYNTADNAYMHFYCSSITIEGGADVAEPFQISKPDQAPEISPGMVVVIDEKNPGQLKVSDHGYDTRVAGVVSGAKGINPGIQMQQQGLLEGGKNVALTGRVYVQADTSNGAIKPGDLLTTSNIPGHAMKVTDHAQAQGAILGKAMSGLDEGQGMVLVLVTLQ